MPDSGWDKYQRTLDKYTLEFLDLTQCLESQNLSRSEFFGEFVEGKWVDLHLYIEDYLNLKTLIANNCSLEDIYLDSISLTRLILNHNQLTHIRGLGELINLEFLEVTGNKLEKLELDNCVNLKYLYCGWNNLPELRVKNLKNLKVLHCYNNVMKNLDCSGLTDLEDLNCANNVQCICVDYHKETRRNECQFVALWDLKLEGCTNLKYLDAAENALAGVFQKEKIVLPHLPNLIYLSLRENNFCYGDKKSKILILDAPLISYLDISCSNIIEICRRCDLPYLEAICGKDNERLLIEQQRKKMAEKEAWEQYVKSKTKEVELEERKRDKQSE